MIHEGNVEEILGENGYLTGINQTTNDEGEIINEEEVIIKAQSITICSLSY